MVCIVYVFQYLAGGLIDGSAGCFVISDHVDPIVRRDMKPRRSDCKA